MLIENNLWKDNDEIPNLLGGNQIERQYKGGGIVLNEHLVCYILKLR